MGKFDNDIIKAREIVENYNEHNLNTLEILTSYDPVTRTRYYKKTAIDINAHAFKDKFIESKKKKKAPKEVKSKVSVSKAQTETSKALFKPESKATKIYNLHLEGLSNKEIANRLDIQTRAVTMAISGRKHKLGLTKNTKETFDEVKNLYSQGLTVKQISIKLNKASHTISYHIKNLNKKNPGIKEGLLHDRKCTICNKEYNAVSSNQNTCSKECRKERNRQQVREYRLNNKIGTQC